MSDIRPTVTDHAVVSWLERLHGLGPEIAEAFPDRAWDSEKATFGCGLLGITVDEARDAILPKRLHEGLAFGARTVLAHDRILICRGGRVITTFTPGMSRRRPEYGNPLS